MIFTIEERNVGRPQFFGRGAFLLDPVRNVIKDVAAPLPYMKIRRAADRQFTVANRSIGSSEFVPSVAVFNERRIVDVFDIA